MTTDQYIAIYKPVAKSESRRTGIPISIILGQGILESQSGNSYLAKSGNNHFGVKCHGWNGATVYANDDLLHECFRAYESPVDSFIDHSNFLMKYANYKPLFDLPSDDYISWAKGLKKAGYATASNYDSALIKVIQDNNLHKLDEANFLDRIFTAEFIFPAVIVVLLIALILYYRKINKK